MNTFLGTIVEMLNEILNGPATGQGGFLILGAVGLAIYVTIAPFRIGRWVLKIRNRRARVRRLDETLAEFLGELPNLRQILIEVERQMSGNTLDTLVRFFNLISLWHDRGLERIVAELRDFEKYAVLIRTLETLALHFRNAGRDQYGWNRTGRGETVTADKVFLGNIFGLWTKTVADWQALSKDEPVWRLRNDGNWHAGGEGLSTREVIERQARVFMRNHIRPMVGLIDELVGTVNLARAA